MQSIAEKCKKYAKLRTHTQHQDAVSRFEIITNKNSSKERVKMLVATQYLSQWKLPRGEGESAPPGAIGFASSRKK